MNNMYNMYINVIIVRDRTFPLLIYHIFYNKLSFVTITIRIL